jgi:hypothetical protein
MEKLIYGCCGLNCEECPVFIATVNDDDVLRQKTADEWSKLYSEYIGKDALKVEDMNCEGCQSEGGLLFIGCRNCPIRACCREKQLSTCASCHDYKTCEMLHGFFGHAPQAKENLERIRDSLH